MGLVVLAARDNNVISHWVRGRLNSKQRIFALDLHTSVSRDIALSLKKSGFKVSRWSISESSYLFKEPNLNLRYVNSTTWRTIGHLEREKFREKYQSFLLQIDCFLVTYSFSLIELFDVFKKPTLAINATRYESPFTFSQLEFEELNKKIAELVQIGKLVIISNNLGDRDYLRLLANVESKYIPSLCEYIPARLGTLDRWVVISRNVKLAKEIAMANPKLISQHDLYPNGFTNEEFALNKGVVLIPYNISSMRLFELVTAGFQIRIPTDRLLMEWRHLPGVLSELSFVQIEARACPSWLKCTPADPDWSGFYDWWLSRADWHNLEYFPNVKLFDSVEELDLEAKEIDVGLRNEVIRNLWKQSTDSFYDLSVSTRESSQS